MKNLLSCYLKNISTVNMICQNSIININAKITIYNDEVIMDIKLTGYAIRFNGSSLMQKWVDDICHVSMLAS